MCIFWCFACVSARLLRNKPQTWTLYNCIHTQIQTNQPDEMTIVIVAVVCNSRGTVRNSSPDENPNYRLSRSGCFQKIAKIRNTNAQHRFSTQPIAVVFSRIVWTTRFPKIAHTIFGHDATRHTQTYTTRTQAHLFGGRWCRLTMCLRNCDRGITELLCILYGIRTKTAHTKSYANYKMMNTVAYRLFYWWNVDSECHSHTATPKST